jgi:hypothetical protein
MSRDIRGNGVQEGVSSILIGSTKGFKYLRRDQKPLRHVPSV